MFLNDCYNAPFYTHMGSIKLDIICIQVHVCIDPLFLNWMRYAAAATNDCQPVSEVNIVLPSNMSSTSIGQRRLRKVSESSRATTPQESVHSSSDREQQLPVASIPKTCIEETDITECSQDEVYYKLHFFKTCS